MDRMCNPSFSMVFEKKIDGSLMDRIHHFRWFLRKKLMGLWCEVCCVVLGLNTKPKILNGLGINGNPSLDCSWNVFLYLIVSHSSTTLARQSPFCWLSESYSWPCLGSYWVPCLHHKSFDHSWVQWCKVEVYMHHVLSSFCAMFVLKS